MKRKPELELTPTPAKKQKIDEPLDFPAQRAFFDVNSCVFHPIISLVRSNGPTDLKWIDTYLLNGQEIKAGDNNYLMKLAPHQVLKVEDQAREYLLSRDTTNALKYCEFWYPITDTDFKSVSTRVSYIQDLCPHSIESNQMKSHEFFDVRITPLFGNNLAHWSKVFLDKLSDLEIAKIVLGAVTAMAFLSDHNVFHGDLNAGNVLINDNHQVKIIDFGRSIIYKKQADNWAFSTPKRQDKKEWQVHRLRDNLFETDIGNYFPPESYIPFYSRKQIEAIFKSKGMKWIDVIQPHGDFGWEKFYGFSKYYVGQSNMYMLVYTMFSALRIDEEPRVTTLNSLFKLLEPYLEENPANRPKIANTLQQLEKLIASKTVPSLAALKALEPKMLEPKMLKPKEPKIEVKTSEPESSDKESSKSDITPTPDDLDDFGHPDDFGLVPYPELEEFVPGID